MRVNSLALLLLQPGLFQGISPSRSSIDATRSSSTLVGRSVVLDHRKPLCVVGKRIDGRIASFIPLII
jgi:hypothetical protein